MDWKTIGEIARLELTTSHAPLEMYRLRLIAESAEALSAYRLAASLRADSADMPLRPQQPEDRSAPAMGYIRVAAR